MLRLRSAAGQHAGHDLHLRVYVLCGLRDAQTERTLPELRWKPRAKTSATSGKTSEVSTVDQTREDGAGLSCRARYHITVITADPCGTVGTPRRAACSRQGAAPRLSRSPLSRDENPDAVSSVSTRSAPAQNRA